MLHILFLPERGYQSINLYEIARRLFVCLSVRLSVTNCLPARMQQ